MTVTGLEDAIRALKLAPELAVKAAIAGINRTQEEAMAAGKAEILGRFTDRTSKFLKTIPTGQSGSPIPRDWRATATSPWATVAIGGGPGIGDNRRNILEPFEEGKTRKAHDMPVFIPTKALRANKSDIIPKAMQPRYLLGKFNKKGEFEGLKSRRAKHTKLGKGRSLHSYFLVQGSVNSKADGIWERTGPGRNDTRMIWAARQSVKRPAMLQWLATTTRVANERLSVNVAGMINVALDAIVRRG